MSAPSLPAIISEIRATPVLHRARVEQVLGVPLIESGGTRYFHMYEARTEAADGARLDLDFREPKAEAGATAGPLLNIQVQGPCIAKALVERTYGPLKITGVPTGRSLDEQLSLSRSESWGELSFGFAEGRPDCLSSVSFSYKR